MRPRVEPSRGRRLAGCLALVLAAVAASSAPAQAGTDAARAHPRRMAVVLVANSYDGTVDLLDARTFHRLGRPLNVIPDGATPRDPQKAALYPTVIASRGEVNYSQDVEISPSGRVLYVSRGYLGDVAAFSLRTRRILWRTDLPSIRADHARISPDGSRLFATALPGNKVYALDARSGRITGSFEAGDYPHELQFSPNGRLVYNGSLGNQLAPIGHDRGLHQLTVADARTLRVVRRYVFADGVRPFAITPDGRRAILQLSFLNGFVVLDLRTGRRRVVELPLSPSAARLPLAEYPNRAAHHGIALSHDGRWVCDLGTISDYAALVPRPGYAPYTLIPVGMAPGEAETSLDGRSCLAVSRGPTGLDRPHVRGLNGDSLSVISYARRREVRRVRVGRHPQDLDEGLIPRTVLRAGGFLR
jgi:DNA-binding beta-propeller fold protein YncE